MSNPYDQNPQTPQNPQNPQNPQSPHDPQSPQEAFGQAPENPYGQAPQNPYGQAPENPYAQAPENPYGQAPQNPYGQAPQNTYGQAPENPYAQAPVNPYGQAPQDPYAANPYSAGYGAAPQPHPRGTTVFVLGIVSIVLALCGGLFGIAAGAIAFVMGTSTLKEIDANPSAYDNRSKVNTGRTLGMIGAVVGVLALIGGVVFRMSQG